jgi:hypothetical protein
MYMKKLFFFVIAGIIVSACSNSGSNTSNTNSGPRKDRIEITNDLENALATIPSWKGEQTIFDMKDKAHSGGFVCITNDTLEFSYGYKEMFKNINDGLPKRVVFSGWINTTVINPQFSILCTIDENSKQLEWKAFPLQNVLTEPGKWVEFTADFYLDKFPIKPEDQITLLAWNQSKKPIYMDDLKITFLY